MGHSPRPHRLLLAGLVLQTEASAELPVDWAVGSGAEKSDADSRLTTSADRKEQDASPGTGTQRFWLAEDKIEAVGLGVDGESPMACQVSGLLDDSKSRIRGVSHFWAPDRGGRGIECGGGGGAYGTNSSAVRFSLETILGVEKEPAGQAASPETGTKRSWLAAEITVPAEDVVVAEAFTGSTRYCDPPAFSASWLEERPREGGP